MARRVRNRRKRNRVRRQMESNDREKKTLEPTGIAEAIDRDMVGALVVVVVD